MTASDLTFAAKCTAAEGWVSANQMMLDGFFSFFLARRWNLFPEMSKVLVENGRMTGYFLGCRGVNWMAVGPWVVEETVQQPQILLEALEAAAGNAVFSIGVLESNKRAVELIRAYGFLERSDSPWRMTLGPDKDLGASAQCLAVGSAAKG